MTTFIFPGQGSQYLGMSKDFYNIYKVAKNVIEEMLSSLISNTILSMEIKDLDLIISDQVLSQTIKKKFLDE